MTKKNNIIKKIYELSLVQTHYHILLSLIERDLAESKTAEDQEVIIIHYRDQVRNYYECVLDLKRTLEDWFKYEKDNDLVRRVDYRRIYKKIKEVRLPTI